MTHPASLFSLLNLPACELRTTVQDGMTKVFDVLRQRYVALTPEE